MTELLNIIAQLVWSNSLSFINKYPDSINNNCLYIQPDDPNQKELVARQIYKKVLEMATSISWAVIAGVGPGT